MSKAWIEDLWLTEPRETLPDGSKVKIPVPSSVTKSLAAYMMYWGWCRFLGL